MYYYFFFNLSVYIEALSLGKDAEIPTMDYEIKFMRH